MLVGRSLKQASERRSRSERGIALVTALLLLALLTGLTIAMFFAVNSDMITNGYYRNFRGSYYAADSGLAIVRQSLKNKITANMGKATKSDPPLAAGIDATILTQLKSDWASDTEFKEITNGDAVADSVAARFRIEPGTLSFFLKECHTDVTPNTCAGVTNAKQWNYTYEYHIVSVGQAGLSHQNKVEERGWLTVVYPVDNGFPKNFSGYGIYVHDQQYCPEGSQGFAPGDVWGKVYTGSCFTFGTSGTVTFHDPVRCGGDSVGYQFDPYLRHSQCTYAKPTDTDKKGNVLPLTPRSKDGVTISPKFLGGIELNAKEPPLPENSYSQKQAVLDSEGLAENPNWETDAAKTLRDASGNPYVPNATSGVYLPYDEKGNYTGGGIYVAGDAEIKLSTNTPDSTHVQQIYTILNNGVTTTITVTQELNLDWSKDPAHQRYTLDGTGTTSIQVGSGTPKVSPGIPIQKDGTGFVDNAAMLYVNGNINKLSGQVQDDTALTITALGDVKINDNLKYKTKPITTKDSEAKDPNTKQWLPQDSIIPGNDKGQALGIFTANGDIYTSADADVNKCTDGVKGTCLEVDASLATISENGTGGLKIPNTSDKIDYLTIVGGRIANSLYGTTKLGKRSVYFDQRFAGTLSPPFFPSTNPGSFTPADGSPVVQFRRLQWVNQTAY